MSEAPQLIRTEHYEIAYKSDFNTRHRGLRFTGVLEPYRAIRIDGVHVLAVLIKDRWFIVASSATDDCIFQDIGPFPTPEIAYVAMRLSAD